MERLHFSTLWQNEKWSDLTLLIKPRCSHGDKQNTSTGPSSSTPALPEIPRRMTRSMIKCSPAMPGQQQVKAGLSTCTSLTTQPSRRRKRLECRNASDSIASTTPAHKLNSQGTHGSATRTAQTQLSADVKETVTHAPQPALGTSALPPGALAFPAHVAVLIATSDYFRRYFDAWHPQDGSKIVTLEVEPDEVEAAGMMLRSAL